NPSVGVVKTELTGLVITLEAVVFAIDPHLAAEFERVPAVRPIEDCLERMAVDRAILVCVPVAQRCSGARGASEIHPRETPNALADQTVVVRRKPEGRQVESVLSFRCVCNAAESIEAVAYVQNCASVKGMNLIQHRLLRKEAEPVSNVACACVVVVRTVASVLTVAPEKAILGTEVLIDSGCVVVVFPCLLCQR